MIVFVPKKSHSLLAVNVCPALLYAAVGSHDENFCLRLAVFDQFDSILERGLVAAFRGLPNHEISRRLAASFRRYLLRNPLNSAPILSCTRRTPVAEPRKCCIIIANTISSPSAVVV